jgi:polyisoprenoid-binding protein YceI
MKPLALLVLLLTFVQAQVSVTPQVFVTLSPESFVEYDASDANATWTGRAPVSRLEFTLNTEQLGDSSLTIVVNPGDFSSGNIFRDTNARRTLFETTTYPEIVFVVKSIRAETDTLLDGETREVTLTGDLTMHGVTKELETVASLTRTGSTVTATGGFEVTYTEFGMRQPTLFAVVVNDTVTIRFNVIGDIQ